jgi:hypothetical protein
MFGFICYLFVYALYLMQLLEQPFLKGHNTFDDVSLFLLTEFAERLGDHEQPPTPTVERRARAIVKTIYDATMGGRCGCCSLVRRAML